MAHDHGHNEVRAAVVELDVTSNGQTIEVAVEKAWKAFGHIDALINNAGVRDFLLSCGPSTMAHDHDLDGVRAVAIELDVTSNGQTIEVAMLKAWEVFGHIDVLINNAGVRAAWLVSKYVGKCMRDGGRGGSIINISSNAGLHRVQILGAVAYASSKGAIHILTKTMALEMGKWNIRVNAIAAGIFRSEITESLFQKYWLQNVALRTIPLKTWGESDPALTSIIRYLIHDSSDYISGNIFIVDAEYTLPGIPIFSSL
ncbi:hypothetical protein Vadar_017527 [Vaccinium darrowii]|uniref:Uncharacterized protein n=1 Tax=Vaccinium darrowii TaxID=229202 RepID=A0ACB7YMP2_9ERIC|nr:hypothetical protein Vadar_017527 [Vaccinium darrowii]